LWHGIRDDQNRYDAQLSRLSEFICIAHQQNLGPFDAIFSGPLLVSFSRIMQNSPIAMMEILGLDPYQSRTHFISIFILRGKRKNCRNQQRKGKRSEQNRSGRGWSDNTQESGYCLLFEAESPPYRLYRSAFALPFLPAISPGALPQTGIAPLSALAAKQLPAMKSRGIGPIRGSRPPSCKSVFLRQDPS